MEGGNGHPAITNGSGSSSSVAMIIVRCTRRFHAAMLADLRRPHEFAYERVGWVFAKQARAKSDVLLLPVEYVPVEDANYIRSARAAACFDTQTIRGALQHARNSGLSCLQVHLDDHAGDTDFSDTDIETIDALAASLRVVAPNTAHGGLVLSQASGTARVWWTDLALPAAAQVSIVGFPTRFGPPHP